MKTRLMLSTAAVVFAATASVGLAGTVQRYGIGAAGAQGHGLITTTASTDARAAVQRYGMGDFAAQGRAVNGRPSVVAVSTGTSFQWGDAAIGAAASTGALLLLAGCSLLLLRRRGVLAH